MSPTSKTRKNLVSDPGRVTEIAGAIAQGKLSPIGVMEDYLERIEKVDSEVQAWRFVDADKALAEAKQHEIEARAGRVRGPLHGVPFAVKDNIDVEGITTLCGSRSRNEAVPESADSGVVLSLRAAGAIPIGKVHTTEFAFFDPSPARNPHNLAHTPGGSSSGSGAAVAAGMVPIAIGTQTIASVNRPAAYCGIGAFKPSTGAMPSNGVTPLAPVFDTVGFFGFAIEDAVAAYEATQPAFLRYGAAPASPQPAVLIFEDDHLSDASPEVLAALDRLAAALAGAGYDVARTPSPVSFALLFELQQLMMFYEIGRSLRTLESAPKGSVGTRILEAVAKGRTIPLAEYVGARMEMDRLRVALVQTLGDAAALWPATPAPAPEGLSSTGNPSYIAPWTAIGGPIVSIPTGFTSKGLPMGCILTGRPGSDARMCGWARTIAPVARVAAH